MPGLGGEVAYENDGRRIIRVRQAGGLRQRFLAFQDVKALWLVIAGSRCNPPGLQDLIQLLLFDRLRSKIAFRISVFRKFQELHKPYPLSADSVDDKYILSNRQFECNDYYDDSPIITIDI